MRSAVVFSPALILLTQALPNLFDSEWEGIQNPQLRVPVLPVLNPPYRRRGTPPWPDDDLIPQRKEIYTSDEFCLFLYGPWKKSLVWPRDVPPPVISTWVTKISIRVMRLSCRDNRPIEERTAIGDRHELDRSIDKEQYQEVTVVGQWELECAEDLVLYIEDRINGDGEPDTYGTCEPPTLREDMEEYLKAEKRHKTIHSDSMQKYQWPRNEPARFTDAEGSWAPQDRVGCQDFPALPYPEFVRHMPRDWYQRLLSVALSFDPAGAETSSSGSKRKSPRS